MQLKISSEPLLRRDVREHLSARIYAAREIAQNVLDTGGRDKNMFMHGLYEFIGGLVHGDVIKIAGVRARGTGLFLSRTEIDVFRPPLSESLVRLIYIENVPPTNVIGGCNTISAPKQYSAHVATLITDEIEFPDVT